MTHNRLRRGQRHAWLVARVMAMRAVCGVGNADFIVRVARMYGVPMELIMSRRDFARRPKR